MNAVLLTWHACAVQVCELQQRAEEAAAVSRRLESEADQQMAQITDLQERLLAAETSNKQLTANCVQKDVEVRRPVVIGQTSGSG